MKQIALYLCLVISSLMALSAPLLAHAPLPDTNAPLIGTPVIQPSTPSYSAPVTVSVNVTDDRSGVKNVTVVYTTDNWSMVNATVVASYNVTTETAAAQIPALATGGHVAFYVVAFDNHGNRAVNNNSGTYFGYDVAAPPPGIPVTTNSWIVIAIIAGGVGVFAVTALRFLRKRPQTSYHSSN